MTLFSDGFSQRMGRLVLVAARGGILISAAGAPLGCKDAAKESATLASRDVAQVADLVEKDVREVQRGLPEGAKKLARLVAGTTDPRQDVAGARQALLHMRRDVSDLNIAKSTFFALTDPSGIAIRNDLEEDVMAGQNLITLFPALAKARDGFVMTTGAFSNVPTQNGPDKDWVAAVAVERADTSPGALLVTGWSYRYFARHLQEALKTRLLDEAKAGENRGKLPVYYVAVFDPSGVYSAPLTPPVDEKALAGENLVAKTASGPYSGTLSIAERAFGFAARRTPAMAADVGVVVLRSDF